METITNTVLHNSDAVAVMLLDSSDRVVETASRSGMFGASEAESVARQIADLRASMTADQDEFILAWFDDTSLSICYRRLGSDRSIAVLFHGRREIGAIRRAVKEILYHYS